MKHLVSLLLVCLYVPTLFGASRAVIARDPAPALQTFIAASNQYTGSFVGKSAVVSEQAVLGVELINATDWTLGNNWSGDTVSGFTKVAGDATSVSKPITSGTGFYQIAFTVTGATAGELAVSIGGSTTFDLYKGDRNQRYYLGPQSSSNGCLVFLSDAAFNGTITDISCRQIINSYDPTISIIGSGNSSSFCIRSTSNGLYNTFIGIKSGQLNTTGDNNTSYGDNSLTNNTSGFWNSAIGSSTLKKNTTGSRNIAVGYNALAANITGSRNVAVGTFSNVRNDNGTNNVSMGADSLFYNTNGNQNVAIGVGAGYNLKNANRNTAVGATALNSDVSGNLNTAIGYDAAYGVTGANGLYLGAYSGRNAAGDNNVYIDNIYRGVNGTNSLMIGKTDASLAYQWLAVHGKFGVYGGGLYGTNGVASCRTNEWTTAELGLGNFGTWNSNASGVIYMSINIGGTVTNKLMLP